VLGFGGWVLGEASREEPAWRGIFYKGEKMIKGFAHICFIVSDLERSVKFYRDVLGFKEAFDFTDEKRGKFGAYLHINNRCFIEMFKGELKPRAEGQPYGHFCLEVNEIEKTVTELRKKGLDVTEVKLGSDQSYQAWLADPDGNRIELHEYTEKSRQNIHLK